MVTCHSCLGGGCVVSPPCLFRCFLRGAAVAFGAPCGTSYLLLSFRASRGGRLPSPISPITEPFFNNDRGDGGLYITAWVGAGASRRFPLGTEAPKKLGSHSRLPLSPFVLVDDLRAARMHHFHCQPLCGHPQTRHRRGPVGGGGKARCCVLME